MYHKVGHWGKPASRVFKRVSATSVAGRVCQISVVVLQQGEFVQPSHRTEQRPVIHTVATTCMRRWSEMPDSFSGWGMNMWRADGDIDAWRVVPFVYIHSTLRYSNSIFRSIENPPSSFILPTMRETPSPLCALCGWT